jgi:hypothetical protein
VGPPQARRRLLTPAAARRAGVSLAAALAALLLACVRDPAREADRAFTAGMAQVDEVEIGVASARPPRVRVDVKGTLPDPCTEIDRVQTQRLGPSQVEITITTRRPFGADCAPAPTPFERSIPLMLGGSFRLWVIEVNGRRSTVSLPPDFGPGTPNLPSHD